MPRALPLLVCLALLVPLRARAEGPPPDRPQGVFAVEDTLEVPPDFVMDPLRIRAERLSIGEIVERCIAREREMQERIRTLEYTAIGRVTFTVGGPDAADSRRMIRETVERVFLRKPDETRTVRLKDEAYRIERGERTPWDLEADDEPVVLDVGDLNELPFYLDEREAYDFRILEREVAGGRVLYRVSLVPRSDFEIAPRGRIWVDTSTYSIVHEEFDFGDRVPLPLFVKRLGPVLRERERIGDVWVWKRLVVHVELHGGRFRWLEKDMPDAADLVFLFHDVRVNEPWSEPAEGAAR